jgi:hypothetical protein
MTTQISQSEQETQRRNRIASYRRKYVAGKVALKQLAMRRSGMFAEALWSHIARFPLSPSDRELFNPLPHPTPKS